MEKVAIGRKPENSVVPNGRAIPREYLGEEKQGVVCPRMIPDGRSRRAWIKLNHMSLRKTSRINRIPKSDNSDVVQ